MLSLCENSADGQEHNVMLVGIAGCGTIAEVITDFVVEGKLSVDLKFFQDPDTEKAQHLASKVDGVVVRDIEDMLGDVDLVIEDVSTPLAVEIFPQILKQGKDIIIISIATLLDLKFKKYLERLALENNCRIYAPSGDIVGLDGVKAVSMGKITEVNLITREPPRSLGISTDNEIILYEGKASDAVLKFPLSINMAAALSIACDHEVDVKIIADPKVDCNIHEVRVVGDFGELKTTTKNINCVTNPKTSILAAYSVIKLLRNLNNNIRIGT